MGRDKELTSFKDPIYLGTNIQKRFWLIKVNKTIATKSEK